MNKWKRRYLDLQDTHQEQAKEVDDIITGLINLAHDNGLVIAQADGPLWQAINTYRTRKWEEWAYWDRWLLRTKAKEAYFQTLQARNTESILGPFDMPKEDTP